MVIIETPTVRRLFSNSVAANYGPEILAQFGSGAARITIRAIMPQGAGAYRQDLAADLQTRKGTNAALLGSRWVTAMPTARQQLIAGQVDTRLVKLLSYLASNNPISIIRFGSDAPYASPGLPLRYVYLAQNDRAAHLSTVAYVQNMLASVGSQQGIFRPTFMQDTVLPGGLAVLLIEYPAPSILGLGGPQK
jgi:hypothetical protein